MLFKYLGWTEALFGASTVGFDIFLGGIIAFMVSLFFAYRYSGDQGYAQ
ncbi:MAG: hypothetical protein UZ21_OP11001000036 [Microgenomates bacterium OLB22]|nr:MAG: hypothetical protein UZ21_OP11001000036 [Microgenomates bacterium OLB22]